LGIFVVADHIACLAAVARGKGGAMKNLWKDESGQDIAEYAVMLAVILVIVVGTIKLIGTNANNVFSAVGNSLVQPPAQ
jgi:Flp pilus assembly pilin Flp